MTDLMKFELKSKKEVSTSHVMSLTHLLASQINKIVFTGGRPLRLRTAPQNDTPNTKILLLFFDIYIRKV